ncbi:3-hydroxylacyl-ACP dehydratase [Methylomonas sp. HYX-M1]|uniref:ApeP family dehydratase n=1 Tax=Methylomonas sp. HYX-M1 TaxID=3139307 RepID=UPI00345BA793
MPDNFPLADLLPQSRNMILIDRLLAADDQHALVQLSVRDDGLFSGPDRCVPAWLGLEYMAQTIGAYSGYQRRRAGLEIGLGFLLGTRHYQSSVDRFPCGAVLTVRAEKIIEAANDMAVFDCKIDGAGIQAAAKLNVLLPEDWQRFIAQKAA